MNAARTSYLLLLIIVFVYCTTPVVHAQVIQVNDSIIGDRNKVSKQIIQLRDTISTRVITLNSKLPETTATTKPAVEKALRDMKFYQAQLEKGLDEIMNTKTWQADISNRSTRLLTDMRQKFKITENELEKIGYP